MLCRGLSGCKGFFSAACGKKCGLAGPCGRATVRMGAARPALPASGSGIMAAAVSKAHAAAAPAMKPQKQCSCPAMPRCGLEKPPAASARRRSRGKRCLGVKKNSVQRRSIFAFQHEKAAAAPTPRMVWRGGPDSRGRAPTPSGAIGKTLRTCSGGLLRKACRCAPAAQAHPPRGPGVPRRSRPERVGLGGEPRERRTGSGPQGCKP